MFLDVSECRLLTKVPKLRRLTSDLPLVACRRIFESSILWFDFDWLVMPGPRQKPMGPWEKSDASPGPNARWFMVRLPSSAPSPVYSFGLVGCVPLTWSLETQISTFFVLLPYIYMYIYIYTYIQVVSPFCWPFIHWLRNPRPGAFTINAGDLIQVGKA